MNLISRHVDARRITKNKNLIYVSVLRCFITFSLSSSSQGHHDEHWNSKDWRKDNRDLIKTSQKKFSIPLKRIKAKFPFDQPVRLSFSLRFPALKFVCCLFSKNRWKSSNRCEIYCRFWSSNVRRFEFGKKLKDIFLRSNFWFWFNWKKKNSDDEEKSCFLRCYQIENNEFKLKLLPWREKIDFPSAKFVVPRKNNSKKFDFGKRNFFFQSAETNFVFCFSLRIKSVYFRTKKNRFSSNLRFWRSIFLFFFFHPENFRFFRNSNRSAPFLKRTKINKLFFSRPTENFFV